MDEPVNIIAFAQADAPQMDLLDAKSRATIRFADPAAWMLATAVARAAAKIPGVLDACLHEIGVVMVSDLGPGETMAEVASSAAAGQPSPLRYPAANPGSLAGVTCIAFGFRGPTLNLTMPPSEGLGIALQLCAEWLNRDSARYMVLGAFAAPDRSKKLARVILLTRGNSPAGNDPIMRRAFEWLTGANCVDIDPTTA